LASLRPDDTPISVLQRADQALYQSKPTRRGIIDGSPLQTTPSVDSVKQSI